MVWAAKEATVRKHPTESRPVWLLEEELGDRQSRKRVGTNPNHVWARSGHRTTFCFGRVWTTTNLRLVA
jgi:hypothetical protein